MLSAAAYLHAHNIVHRDLKPENILYINSGPDSPIVIADFGIAKALEDEQDEVDEAAGSLEYASPEVILNKGHGTKTDIWSIG